MWKKVFAEKNLHAAFDIGVVLKGVHALFEALAGFSLFFITKAFIVQTLFDWSQQELREDPRDFIATHLLETAKTLTTGGQHFAAWYLLSHGVVKLFLVINLYRERLWAYPASLVVFGSFVLYQLYRWSLTYSFSLLLLTFLDIVVILLTWHEYRYKKTLLREKHSASPL